MVPEYPCGSDTARAFRLLPGEIVLVVLSLFSSLAGASLLALGLGWSVIAVVLYESTALFVPNVVSSPKFRSLFTLFALAQAIVITDVSAPDEPVQTATNFFVLIAVSIVCFLGYLRFVAGWDFFDLDGSAVTLLDEFAPWVDAREELRTDLDFEGPVRTFALVTWVAAIGVVLVVPCAITGFVAALLSDAFPLPDVLLLTLVAAKTDVLPLSRKSLGWLALEDRAYAALDSATRNLKGAMLITLSAVGGLAAAGLFSIVASRLLDFVTVLRLAVPFSPLVAWDFLGLILLFPATTVYALWYWVRQLERIEGFLDRQFGVPTVFAGPTRPRGLTILPTLALVGIASFLASSTPSNQRPWLAFAIAWPGLLASLVAGVYWTRSTPPQEPSHEDGAVVVSLFVQFAGVRMAGTMRRVVDGQWLVALLDPELVFGLVAIVGATYLPDVVRYEAGKDDLRRYAGSAYLFVLGVLTGGTALTERGKIGVLFVAFAGVCLVGATAIAGAKYLEG